MKIDFPGPLWLRFFLSAFLGPLLFFSCGGGKEAPYTLAPREGLVSDAEAAAILAKEYIEGLTGAPEGEEGEGEGRRGGLRPNADGSVSVTGALGGELVRFYRFETEAGPETVGITPEGYYRASRRGAGCLMVKTKKGVYSLEQFAEVLFRPDLLENPREPGGRETLAGLLAAPAPPPPSILGRAALTFRDGKPCLGFSAACEPGGGLGTLALFYRDRLGGEYPAAVLDAGSFVREKRREGGKTVYDLFLPLPETPQFSIGGFAGVSVFNADNTASSGRLWVEIPGRREALEPSGKPPPVLHVVTASSGAGEDLRALEEAFARQESGALYRAVRVRGLHGADLGREGFFRVFHDELAAEAGEGDVVFCVFSLPGSIDGRGDFFFSLPGGSGEGALDKWDLAAAFSSLKTQKVLLFLDVRGSLGAGEREAAFLRLRDWLGPGVFLGFGSPGEAPRDRLTRVLLEAAGGAWAGDRRCLGAAEFSRFVQKALPAQAAFLSAEDFPFIDLYRRRAPGEPRARAVTPEFPAGGLKGRLPAFGVDIGELNPGSYKKAGAGVLETMGVPPHYAAFLSGEQFYRSGDYDNAIAEYSRSLSLKGDYTEAFVSRGNAWRRKGETNRAIADYTRALSLKGDYAEVYNYRGFLYAGQGNHERAGEDYTRALRLKSGYADAWFNRAYGYAELKDWDRAIADYTQVIKLEPSNAAAYRERAYAWSNKGDKAKAAADYAAAERLE